MIQFLQNRLLNGELGTNGLISSPERKSLLPDLQAEDPFFFDLSEGQNNQPDNDLYIEGDFKLDTNQSQMDLVSELNKMDILSLKFEKISLNLDKFAL